jgi:hypothetical protein
MLAHQGPHDVVLNQHMQGLPPWSLEYLLILSLIFPSDDTPFSPSCPVWSQINQLSISPPTKVIFEPRG